MREKLELCPVEEVRGRHLGHFLALAGSVGVRGRDQRRWLTRVDTEHDNLRAALDWAVSHEHVGLALGLARALGWFWYLHGPCQETTDRLEAVLRLHVALPPSRPACWAGPGPSPSAASTFPGASSCCEENLRLCLELGDDVSVLPWLRGLCALVEPSRRFGLAWVAYFEDRLGMATRRRGDLVRARSSHEQALSIYREPGLAKGAALALARLGALAELEGDLEAARAHHRESLALMAGGPERAAIVLSVEGMAAVAVAGGHAERASVLFGVATALRDTAHAPRQQAEWVCVDRTEVAARAVLGDEAHDSAMHKGRSLSCKEAVALALAS